MSVDGHLIRPARQDDVAGLAELIREHAAYERAAPPRPDLATALAGILFHPEPRLHALVAVRPDRILGYATWSLEVSTWNASAYAHLDCLYLREETRGHGLGRDPLEAVENEARAAGVNELRWQTPGWIEGAIRFYRRIGAHGSAKVWFVRPIPPADGSS